MSVQSVVILCQGKSYQTSVMVRGTIKISVNTNITKQTKLLWNQWNFHDAID